MFLRGKRSLRVGETATSLCLLTWNGNRGAAHLHKIVEDEL